MGKSRDAGSQPGPDVVRVVVYDSRGNGGGAIAPTITGDHQNRVTDYTAVVVIYEESKFSSEHGPRMVDDRRDSGDA